MTDPVEPPEVAAWKAVRNADGCWDDIVNHQVTAGDALAAALVAAREEYEVAHRGRMHAIDALHRVEAERDEARAERVRLREALREFAEWNHERDGFGGPWSDCHFYPCRSISSVLANVVPERDQALVDRLRRELRRRARGDARRDVWTAPHPDSTEEPKT